MILPDRPIIAVRFHTAVTLGTQPHDVWFKDRAGFTALAGAITPRMGNPELGEQRTSVVFEVRLGNKPGGVIGDVDVEVPASNLAEIQREPPEPQPGTKGARK